MIFHVLVVIAFGLGALRFYGATSLTYQASAHLFMGLMLTAFVQSWRYTGFKSSVKYGLLALALTLIEVYAFLASRKLI